MGNNTPNESPGDSPGRPVPPPRLPRYEWLHPSVDAPRIQWCDWLVLLSDQLAQDFPGETGLFVSSILGAMASQARELSAYSPSQQEELAQLEADRAAAYLQALMHEAGRPGAWVMIQPDPEDLSDDANGGFEGHPAQPDFDESDTGPIRGWIPRNSDDDTYMN